jgi:hypothetical protein
VLPRFINIDWEVLEMKFADTWNDAVMLRIRKAFALHAQKTRSTLCISWQLLYLDNTMKPVKSGPGQTGHEHMQWKLIWNYCTSNKRKLINAVTKQRATAKRKMWRVLLTPGMWRLVVWYCPRLYGIFVSCMLGLLFDPEDGGSTALPNVGELY